MNGRSPIGEDRTTYIELRPEVRDQLLHFKDAVGAPDYSAAISQLIANPPRSSKAQRGPLPSGATLRRRREALGLTQTEVAHEVGVSFPLISRIENGVSTGARKHGARTILELAAALTRLEAQRARA